MVEIEQYLTNELRALERINASQHICQYRSVGHFVLQNGRLWTPRRKPKGLSWGEKKNCFGNSTTLAMWESENYTYCEGYALGELFPLLHAWCITPEGIVVDRTWRKLGREYFGVAIKHKYLTDAMARQKTYGLIDRWEQRWPLLHAQSSEWRHPINDLKAPEIG